MHLLEDFRQGQAMPGGVQDQIPLFGHKFRGCQILADAHEDLAQPVGPFPLRGILGARSSDAKPMPQTESYGLASTRMPLVASR